MGELIMLIGLPASGKSTLAEKLKETHEATILSSDELRKELYNNINEQNKNTELFKEISNRTKQMLSDGHNVILDATNINRKRRIHLVKNEIKADKYHAYYMNTSIGNCIYNDNLRDRKVGFDVIDRMYKNLHIPTPLEGWDSVKYVRSAYQKESFCKDAFESLLDLDEHDYLFNKLSEIIPEFKQVINTPHDSSYHSFSISRHIFHTHQYILKNYEGERQLEMKIASLFHDIGKGYCKSFFNHKGEKKRYASFIGHENVSAQIACEFLSDLGYEDDFVKYVVDLIQFHMMPMNMGEKNEKRLKKLLTENQYEDLMFLHEADLSAK